MAQPCEVDVVPKDSQSPRVAFFRELFMSDPKLRVQECPGKGIGVFVAEDIEQGDVAFAEQAAGAFQYRQIPLACDHCSRLLGTLDFQFQLLGVPTIRPDDDDGVAQSAELPALEKSERFLAKAHRGWALWRDEGWYCSVDCENCHKNDFAALRGQEAKVRSFVEHALETRTPFYVMALKALLKDPALLPQLMRRPYWECVDLPETEVEEFVAELQADLDTSFGLLRQLNFDGNLATREEYASLVGSLCLNAVAVKFPHPLIMYMQEVDQGLGGVEAKQTLVPLLENIRQRRHRNAMLTQTAKFGCAAGAQVTKDNAACRDDASDDDAAESESVESESDFEDDVLEFKWDLGETQFTFSSRLFPPFKGHGLFPRLSAVNHSCEPNAEVFYAGSGDLLLLARRTLRAGEEVTISYVDHEEEDAEERQKELKPYGFRCDCRRCNPRKRKALKHRGGKKQKMVAAKVKRDIAQ
eukprot:TRINITY_DN49885_c0_g1_i1.p1 TRINITY_DN49885_c0_g1~~TRINITY_DN49885_c0_g1_i1.p1  ORF type:complete len:479 (+),score=93.59 TRINITY_DN49885_c0_g1_i1:28-1437(+)